MITRKINRTQYLPEFLSDEENCYLPFHVLKNTFHFLIFVKSKSFLSISFKYFFNIFRLALN